MRTGYALNGFRYQIDARYADENGTWSKRLNNLSVKRHSLSEAKKHLATDPDFEFVEVHDRMAHIGSTCRWRVDRTVPVTGIEVKS